jgi:SAM-dependent methyltransferase
MNATRRYFERHARSFDRAYGRGVLVRTLRPGPARGRALAAAVVRLHAHPHVLDVGCGPGRVAEAVLAAGASAYVGIDLSPRMLTVARDRLGPAAHVDLLEGDFLDLDVPGEFDVVLALGLFDYLEDPLPAARWLRARCASTLLASFTRRDRLKAPVRSLRYRIHGCRVFDYDERRVAALLQRVGFARIAFPWSGRRGFVVSAEAGAR